WVVLCTAAFWWWCWARWVRRPGRGGEGWAKGTAVDDVTGISGAGGWRERFGLFRRRGVGRSGGGGAEGAGKIPRGSMGWPLIGETLEFVACGYTSRPVSFMEKRRNLARYGRVFKSHILGTPIVVSTDVEVNRAVLQNQEGFVVPCYPRSVRELLGESSILKKEGSVHRRVHGLIGGFFKSQAAKTCVADAIERAVLQSLGRWQEGQLVYVQDEAKAITFQALLKVLLGIEPGKDLDFLKREYSEFVRGLMCLPIKLPGTRLYKSLKAKEKVLKILRKIVEERIQKGGRSSVKDLLDILLNETETHEQKQLLIDSISENITEIMIPGEHSVPVLVTIAVKYLSDFPLVLEQLRVENMNLKREKIKSGEPYAWTDYMSLTFTQHVINETLRMGNIVNGVWRKVVKDTEIKGYLFPKGWGVLTSFSSIHLDEEIYPDPYEFRPWRWEVSNNIHVTLRNKAINHRNFTPFGGGQRLCPGRDLSRIEIAIFLHHLVTNYSWVAEDDAIVHFPTIQLKRKMPIRISATSIRHN
ncbi:hypothetical protein Taro_042361, partial [Colocasia esculenta]|nr:hypothetical protein [Colocasia esculenta]